MESRLHLFPFKSYFYYTGLVADHQPDFEFQMSGNVGSGICKSGTVDNVGLAVGVTLLFRSVQELLLRLVSSGQFSFFLVLLVN